MKPIRLRVPREEAGDLLDDLAAWASVSGVDPGMTTPNPSEATESGDPTILLEVYVSPTFFEQFPEWRPYIEQ
ncbi:hypothetical protein ACW9YV_16755 (plasmid) [Paraburkholderia strydomiana]